jgi:hypothetical protein
MILTEHWCPASLAAMFPAVQASALCSDAIQRADEPEYIGIEKFRHGMSVIACLSAGPHTDHDSPRYTALWIVRSHGHKIGVSDTRPGDLRVVKHRRPRNRAEYDAVTGEIAVLDTHSLHWLLPGDGVFAAVASVWDRMPGVEDVEARFAALGIAADNLNLVFEAVMPPGKA